MPEVPRGVNVEEDLTQSRQDAKEQRQAHVAAFLCDLAPLREIYSTTTMHMLALRSSSFNLTTSSLPCFLAPWRLDRQANRSGGGRLHLYAASLQRRRTGP